MSNNVNIIQQTSTEKHSGRESKEIVVSDDYGMGTIDLDSSDTFYDDDLELLAMVVQSIAEGGFDAITGVLDHVQENETGMNIEGTWYDWDEIKNVFVKS